MSIGVQSLDNDLLNLLGRRHDADGAIAAFRTVRDAGFDNVNLDLIYGLPRQSLEQWQDTLRRLADLEPTHISLYALTVEEGDAATPLGGAGAGAATRRGPGGGYVPVRAGTTGGTGLPPLRDIELVEAGAGFHY